MKCERCVYHTHFDQCEVICYYIVHTGHRRGCPFGDQCTRFIEGRPKNFIREDGYNVFKNRRDYELER